MRHAVRAVPAAVAIGLDAAGVAHAAVTSQPVLGLPALAKAETGALPGELAVTVRWAPATFSPASSDGQFNVGFSLLGGGGGAPALHYYYGPGAAAAFEVADVLNGEQLLVHSGGLRGPGDVAPHHPKPRLRDDPGGRNRAWRDGADRQAARQRRAVRDVTLDPAASDPLVNGIPGSATCVSQMTVDRGQATAPTPAPPF